MAENSAIEWTDHTWSPWEGCQKTGSPACEHCYAEARNARFGGGTPPNWGPHAPRRITADSGWRKPWEWDRLAGERGIRERVFPSLCDPFDNKAPEGARVRFGNMILGTPNLVWLLLTKRIGNAAEMMAEMFGGPPPANVWLGATVVTQEEADRDLPKLLATPAAKRFLSMEPLLGPVDLHAIPVPDSPAYDCANVRLDALTGCHRGVPRLSGTPVPSLPPRLPALDWAIVGGESGFGARPMHPDWARSLRDQCEAAGVPFLFKQWGEWLPWEPDVLPYFQSQTGELIDRHVLPDFNYADLKGWTDSLMYEDSDVVVHQRVGKKAAGRLLDGLTHDGMPSC